MSARREVLASRVRREIGEIDRIVEIASKHWSRTATAGPDQDAFVDSVALNLHGFYSGVEHLFEAIAIEMDDGLPKGEAWHAELIDQMTLDLGTRRPEVFPSALAEQLGEYRRFRHVVRNVYSIHLDPKRIAPLVEQLPDLWIQLRRHMIDFAEFLEATSGTSATDGGPVDQ